MWRTKRATSLRRRHTVSCPRHLEHIFILSHYINAIPLHTITTFVHFPFLYACSFKTILDCLLNLPTLHCCLIPAHLAGYQTHAMKNQDDNCIRTSQTSVFCKPAVTCQTSNRPTNNDKGRDRLIQYKKQELTTTLPNS